MKPEEIRPSAICIFQDRDHWLVADYHDALSVPLYPDGILDFVNQAILAKEGV